MGLNAATPRSQDANKDASSYLEARYTTIHTGILIILAIWGLFSFVAEPKDHKAVNWLWGIGGFLLILLGAAFVLGAGYIGFGERKKPIPLYWRAKLLPWIAGFVIGTVGAMIWISGGAVNSSFSHFLGVICSLSIVLARETKPRVIIGGVSIIVYLLNSLTSFTLLSFLPLPDPLVLTPLKLTLFHNFCFFISVVLALIAAPPGVKEHPVSQHDVASAGS